MMMHALTASLWALFLSFSMACYGCAAGQARSSAPLVIAHRGASGYLPEHTLEAYAAAYFMGADMIEPDVLATRDGQLVCFHDLHLEHVTDVEQHFPTRARADGSWYVIDFDLDELRTLSVTGRSESVWQGMQIPTLDEMLLLVQQLNEQTGRQVGVIPEIKAPDFHRQMGIDLAEETIMAISRSGWDSGPLIIQCFDPGTLMHIHERHGGRFELVQLISDPDEVPELESIAGYARGIGPSRKVIDADPTLVRRANDLGLGVYPYTFKDDTPPYLRYMHDLRVQGLFSDYTDKAIHARETREYSIP